MTSMATMFNSASAFNQNIGGWNTSSVTNMRFMFNRARAFNQDLCPWKDAPAVVNNNDAGMFSGSSGGPKAGDNSFDATQCVVSYFEK